MAAIFVRPALAQHVPIGTLYHARKDQFLPNSILLSNLPKDAFQIVAKSTTEVTANYDETYQKRFDTVGIPAALAGSILADYVRCRGASRYLAERRESRFIHTALQHTIGTCVQTLDSQFRGLRDHVTSARISMNDATHMVTGIDWGARSVISARVYADPAERASTDRELKTLFATFVSAAEGLSLAGQSMSGDLTRIDTSLPVEVTAYSEMFEEDDGILLAGFQEAYEFLQMIPLHVKTAAGASYTSRCAGHLDACFALLDKYVVCERELDGYHTNLHTDAQFLPRGMQQLLRDRLGRLQVARQGFKDEFKRILSSAKSGFMDFGALRQILDQYQSGDLSPEQIGSVSMSSGGALDFIKTATSSGATYVGHKGVSLEKVLGKQSEAYVFYFSQTGMEDAMWGPNLDLLQNILQQRSQDTVVAIVDCDAIPGMIKEVRIAECQDGREVIPDLHEYHVFMADKCFAECDPRTREIKNIEPPIQRRHVTIPCPGSKCSVAKVREWLCPTCMVPVEYGYTDQYVYCQCGRSLYSNFEFRCSSDTHGPHSTPYDSQQLLRMLDGLVQTNYLNILILGKTGVGKSTFINAMVNYLEFETLDEAISADKLNYVIPCSFATQIMDRANPDRPIEEKHIKIGARDDERDGSKGDSATQRTTVYPVTFNSGESTLTVRLIATPGIGDSRGVDADRQNMADILSTLSGYDTVHGILILLKSNNARLTITFRYCIKELLTHLHHNSAANMAFGFTNTRISNYTPGDTYGPLKALLARSPDIGLQLLTPTTYCFDSESFRYLAAFKSGVTMPNKPDFDRSWDQSRQETIRLIEHFQSIPPHEVKNTISLNGARQLISELTKPLAEISQIINTNIHVVEDQKVQMNAEQLPMPRTVCGHQACTEVRDDGKGQNTLVIVYKQHCHPECYLNDVQADVMAHPGLLRCAAFSGHQNCTQCSHHWQQHLHVLYELHEEIVTVTDNGVQQQLANHADEVTLKQTAIRKMEERVAEYRQEQEIIRNAAAKFCVFLKNNSLAPYNDALIAYLDFLIKEEQAKVQAGGNNKRLLSLTLERQKHQEAIQMITNNMQSNAPLNDLSEGGVDRMVKSLYKLKHFGSNLKNMQQGIMTAHQATYRERPYQVRRKNQPKNLGRLVERTPVNQPSQYQSGASSQETGSSQSGSHKTYAKAASGGGFLGSLKKWRF